MARMVSDSEDAGFDDECPLTLATAINNVQPCMLATASDDEGPLTLATAINNVQPCMLATASDDEGPLTLATAINNVQPCMLATASDDEGPLTFATAINNVQPCMLATASDDEGPLTFATAVNNVQPCEEGYANRVKKGSRAAGATSAAAVGSALLAVASGGRAAKATATMAALTLADAAELAVYGSCPASPTIDYGLILKFMLCGIFLGVSLTFGLWWACGRRVEKAQRRQRDPKKGTRSVKTQSQVTYMRKLATPRFQPLAEGDQGVSLDLD